ncbi:transcriptional regulator GcvA [Inquilinus sp. CAU 1745]|uniref:transcriptional regulator GcvA n=1 Tax=Inquilinus sp. CAU 1745 TaxID=3140369 RepID=UPI00325A5F5C
MSRRLPSLNALRAFESAARLGSFSKAADELHVTHGAVSRHVRSLEDRLGVPLFRRLHKKVLLTEDGAGLLPELSAAFDRIARAADAVDRETRRMVRVSVEPAFAARWLVPRLGGFRRDNPDIMIDIDPTNALADFRSDPVDIAIRYGSGTWTGIDCRKLCDIGVFPVASPRLAADIGRPSDLSRHTLLHDETRRWWAQWLSAAGAPADAAEEGPMFRDAGLVLDAAAGDQGIALGDGVLAAADLAAGRLVRLFDLEPLPCQAYWLVGPEAIPDRPPVAMFRGWLMKEISS